MSVPNQLFETALGIASPWYVKGVEFDAERRKLTIGIDFSAGARFPVAGSEAVLPVHDTVIKRLQHLNFFQHECFLEVRTPRVKRKRRLRPIGYPPFAFTAEERVSS